MKIGTIIGTTLGLFIDMNVLENVLINFKTFSHIVTDLTELVSFEA